MISIFIISLEISKYEWIAPLKDKKDITIITNAFAKILDESNRKLSTIWLDKGR